MPNVAQQTRKGTRLTRPAPAHAATYSSTITSPQRLSAELDRVRISRLLYAIESRRRASRLGCSIPEAGASPPCRSPGPYRGCAWTG